MTNGVKASFGATVFIGFCAVFVWAGGLDAGWRGLLLLIAGVPFSVWAAHAITNDKELRRRDDLRDGVAVMQILPITAIVLGLAASAAWATYLGFELYRVIGIMF